MRYLNEIITKIVNINMKKYSYGVIFLEREYMLLEYKDKYVFYRSKSGNKNYKYVIDIHVLENLRNNNNFISYRNKCKYCDKKGAKFKLNCCGTSVHLNCALSYNMACCDISNIINNDINEEECSVCFEKTNNKTICNHPVCKKCLLNIYKIDFKIECPCCRKLLIKRDVQKLHTDLFVEYKKNNIPIHVIYTLDYNI